MLATLYKETLARPGIGRVFWAFLKDTGSHFKDGVDSFGLLRADLSPKPAYAAYAKLTKTLLKK